MWKNGMWAAEEINLLQVSKLSHFNSLGGMVKQKGLPDSRV